MANRGREYQEKLVPYYEMLMVSAADVDNKEH